LGSGAPGAGTNLAATYDGGQVSNTEVVERLSEPWFVTEAEQNAPTNAQMGQVEHVARHLAALHILVDAARKRGFDKRPGWGLEVKLSEQTVLAQALSDEVRRQTFVSDKEASEEYRTNKFMFIGIESIEARMIGIRASKHGEKALARANEALKLIKAGQDFGAVASRFSDLAQEAAQSNAYPADKWGKGAGRALAELGEGRISEPLPVADGYEIVKVERLHLVGNSSAEEAKAQVLRILFEKAVVERMDQITKGAGDAIAFVPSTINSQLSTNPVLLRCGQFELTRQDVRGLAAERGVPAIEDQKMVEVIRQESGIQIQDGELARRMGLDKRPEVQKAQRDALDKRLAEKAKRALLPELVAEMTFDEGRIRNSYESKFTATFEPLMQYDLLVVPLRVPAGASAEERQTVVSNTLAKAQELVKQATEGSSLKALAAADSSLQLMLEQSRTVREGSALYPLVAGLKEGEIAAEPYEDFGGYCVLRVNKYEPRRKMPYDLAKNYILEEFRTQALWELRHNFEPVLLNKYHFAFGAPPSGARGVPTPEPGGTVKTNSLGAVKTL